MLFEREEFSVVLCYGWGASKVCAWSSVFLVYINDLVDNISSEAKVFADGKSVFTVVSDVDIATDKLNRDLEVISNWAHQ